MDPWGKGCAPVVGQLYVLIDPRSLSFANTLKVADLVIAQNPKMRTHSLSLEQPHASQPRNKPVLYFVVTKCEHPKNPPNHSPDQPYVHSLRTILKTLRRMYV